MRNACGRFTEPVAQYLVPERRTQARLFIHMSDSRAKHFPRPLYQTRYGDFCFVRCAPEARGWPPVRYRALIRGDESAKVEYRQGEGRRTIL